MSVLRMLCTTTFLKPVKIANILCFCLCYQNYKVTKWWKKCRFYPSTIFFQVCHFESKGFLLLENKLENTVASSGVSWIPVTDLTSELVSNTSIKRKMHKWRADKYDCLRSL